MFGYSGAARFALIVGTWVGWWFSGRDYGKIINGIVVKLG